MQHEKENGEETISQTSLLAEALGHQRKAMHAWAKFMQKETDVLEKEANASEFSGELKMRISALRSESIVHHSRSLFYYMSLKYVVAENGEISDNDELALIAMFEILNEI